MSTTYIAKGGQLRTMWSLYAPPSSGPPTALTDPDEYPEGPRFEVWPAGGGAAINGFAALAYTRRYAAGVYSFNLPIPFAAGVLDAGDYEIHLVNATTGGTPLVGQSGAVPTVPFTALSDAQAAAGDSLYVTAEELAVRYGIADAVDVEVRAAQQVCDGWMHRSLFPTVYEKERHEIPSDRNLIQLDVRPVIRLYQLQATDPLDAGSIQGRYGYGRRDRRRGNQLGYEYLATLLNVGSPARFFPLDPQLINCHLETGQCWLPVGPFLVSYTQVEVTYEAGFRVIPEAAKWAVAETLGYMRFKGFGPITRYQAGKVSAESAPGLVTENVQRLLADYQVVTLR